MRRLSTSMTKLPFSSSHAGAVRHGRILSTMGRSLSTIGGDVSYALEDKFSIVVNPMSGTELRLGTRVVPDPASDYFPWIITCGEQVVVKCIFKRRAIKTHLRPDYIVDDATAEIAAMQTLQRRHAIG